MPKNVLPVPWVGHATLKPLFPAPRGPGAPCWKAWHGSHYRDSIPATGILSSGVAHCGLVLSQIWMGCCDPRSFASQCLDGLH